MSGLPLLPVTMVGSWPRSSQLNRAIARKRRGEIDGAEFDRIADAAVLDVLRAQEEAGCDLVTDGEQRRDNFYSFVAEKLEGVTLMSLSDMLDVVEDKEGFRRILDTLDWYSPTYQSKHTYEEVFRWYESCGLESLTVGELTLGIRGSKPVRAANREAQFSNTSSASAEAVLKS